MGSTQSLHLPEKWVSALNLGPRLGHDVLHKVTLGIPYAGSINDALRLGVSAVHCIEGVPSVAILHNPENDRGKVHRIHKALWNQGVADFLFVIRDESLTIHSLWASPQETDQRQEDLLLDAFSLLSHQEILFDLLQQVESGSLFSTYSQKIDYKTRVDSRLISDLTAYREELVDDIGISQQQAHNALLQAMFLRYLWDRGIISSKHTQYYGGSEFTNLHDLLRGSLKGWYNLLAFLGKAFNGSMLQPDDVIWSKACYTLSNFIEGLYDPGQKRNRLIQLYQFNHIPVELISEVYDRFLEGKIEKEEHGAYYTPRRLASLLVDITWPSLQTVLDGGKLPRVLDPTCGSGIFLVTIFQRIASYLNKNNNPNRWDSLKEAASNLYGTDTNSTAIQIAAFSLALALLNEREPREIESELVGSKPILPRLKGNCLLTRNFFELSENEKFSTIIGNPPWGQQKGSRSSGEDWTRRHGFPSPPNREKAWPFLWKSQKHIDHNGRLSFLLPTTGCIQNKHVDFSLNVFTRYVRFKTFIDLSDLRNTLFPGAKIPACILSAEHKNTTHKPVYRYDHFCPKADYHSIKSGRIILSPDDKHNIWIQHFLSDPTLICRKLMWSSAIELRLLDYLDSFPKLNDLMSRTDDARDNLSSSSSGWGIGLGFQRYTNEEDKPVELPKLANMPYLSSTKEIVPYVQPKPSSSPHSTIVRRTHFHESFDAPHIVFNPSMKKEFNYNLTATYSEFPFSFNMSLMGISVPDTKEGRDTAKLLTVIINSELISWYLYLTTNIGADRERFSQRYPFMNLPFPKPSDFKSDSKALDIHSSIVKAMDNFNNTWLSKNYLDDLVYQYYGIKNEEIAIIKEFFKKIRPAMHPNIQSSPELWNPVNLDDRNNYCLTLGKAISRKLTGNPQIHTQVIFNTRELSLIRISRNSKVHSATINNNITFKLEQLSQNIKHVMLNQLKNNIYIMRTIFFFIGDDAYLLKPTQHKFWLTRSALRDADYFIDFLLTPDSSNFETLQ